MRGRSRPPRPPWGAALWLVVLLGACDDSAFLGLEPGDGAGTGSGGALSGTGGAATGGSSSLPPERELEETFRAPVGVGRYLFTANPDSNRVARVDARSFEIETFEAGFAPTYLAALPEGVTPGGALVLNARSRDASLYFIDRADEAALVRRTVSVHPGANAWSVGPRGGVAIAWSRAALEAGDDDGYQDVTVLGFEDAPGEVAIHRLSVGYRPSEVFVSADETNAFVVSDPGITAVELGDSPAVVREIFLPEDQGARDVEFSADGKVALVRFEESPEILVVDTATGERRTLTFPKAVTDLDIATDAGLAIAVLRADGESDSIGAAGAPGAEEVVGPGDSLVALMALESVFEDDFSPELVEVPGIVGSVSLAKNGSTAALFTTASSTTEFFTLDTAERKLRKVDVRAAIDAVLVSDEGSFAVSLMKTTDVTLPGAFALVPMKDDLPARISGTTALPVAVALDPLGRGALVATDGGTNGVSSVYLGRFPALSVDATALASRPLAVGIVPTEGRGFVAQEHSEGRLSFVELDSGTTKTITGFELESKVVR